MGEDELQQRVLELSGAQQMRLARKLGVAPPPVMELRPKQRAYLAEWSIDFNGRRAAEAVGLSPSGIGQFHNPVYYPKLAAALKQVIVDLEEECRLKAQYVRDYIRSVMDFCPTDYFEPAPEGGWMIRKDNFDGLPVEVKRLIEHVELRAITRQGTSMVFLAVTFISKTAALNLAARYTLTEKHSVKVETPVPWDQLAKGKDEDEVEKRLQEVESEAARAQGPADVQAIAVA